MEKVKIENLTKRFGEFVALDSINLEVKKGEIHALLGENGAGKSTLMNCLFGFYHLDEGKIFINGNFVDIKNPNIANELGIGMVHQHFKLVKNFNVFQNITLGSEITKGLFLDNKKAKNEIQNLIDKYNFKLDVNKKISDLSVGQQQKVEILKMLYKKSDILIFDEPTGALTPQETEELLNIILDLQKDGKTIILITHKLDEIKMVANRCTIIRKGKTIDTVNVSDVSNNELAKMMVGRVVNFDIDKEDVMTSEISLVVDNLNYYDKNKVQRLKDVSFTLKKGEILGICGVDGNGQVELIENITGMKNSSSGNIIYKDKGKDIDISSMNAKEINSLKISHIPQDRHKHGVILDYTVSQNAVLREYDKKPFSNFSILNNKEIENYGNKLINEHDIRTPNGSSSIVRNMSGGNQQKLIIARELEENPEILIAAQPTRGVDVGAIENIHNKLLNQRVQKKSVILFSLELDELIKLCDRIVVMYNGKVMDIVDPKIISKNEIGLLMVGKEINEK